MLSARSDAVALAGPTAALMAELLHEMGQPLTTLQGCRLLPLLEAGDREALAAEMAGQVDRVTALYRGLRGLFAAAMPVDAEAANPTTRLRDEAAVWAEQAERQGVGLLLDLPLNEIAVRPRAGEALASVVAVALAQAPAGSRLCVTATDEPRAGRRAPVLMLTVQGDQSGPEPVAGVRAEADVALRVAAALLEEDGGRVVYNLQPFRATIELPGTETFPVR